MISKRKKIFTIFIVILILGISFSGMFAWHNNSLAFKYNNKIIPYQAGTFENYTIYGKSEHTTGYLNVSSTGTYVKINMYLKYHNSSSYPHIVTNKILNKTKNGIYYKGKKVILPFFQSTGNTMLEYGNSMLNYSNKNISRSMITCPGLYKYHIGVYIGASESDAAGFGSIILAVYDLHSHLLNDMSDLGNPTFAAITGAYYDNNTSYPIALGLFLHKTNTIVFPVNWIYVMLVYLIVAFALALFIIIPVAAILGITAYRRHRRKKVGHREK